MSTKTYPVKGFGSKLMVASKAINTIPDQYLSYSQNARIYDGGIGPRRGKQLLTNSTIGTSNKGGFVMGGNIFQITNSKIYQIDQTTGNQTEKATLGYDEICDILVYGKNIAVIASPGQELAVFNGSSVVLPGTVPYEVVGTAAITIASPAVVTLNNHGLQAGDPIQFTTTGALPTGLTVGTKYYVISAGLTTNTFKVSASKGGSAINTSGSQSGTHTVNHFYNTGVIEYCRGYSFLSRDNVLYISRPITTTNPEYSYDFTGSGSQQITYDSNIKGMTSTLNGLYIFTEDKVEYLGANSLQNVAGSATFVSTPLGKGSQPIFNLCIAGNGDNVYYVTKNLQIQKINYINGTNATEVGELSARPVISIKELLLKIDVDQPSSYAFFNENDKTIQFHLRTVGSPFNDIVILYDTVNDTWNVDTAKNYCYVIKYGENYYGFSDINSSIYEDDVGYSDAGVPINFQIITNNFAMGTPNYKYFRGFFTMGGIGALTTLNYQFLVDGTTQFTDNVVGDTSMVPSLGDIGGDPIGLEPIAGPLFYTPELVPFDRTADEGRIYVQGKRAQLVISSSSQIQDFIIDVLGLYFEPTLFVDIQDKW